MIVTLDGPAGSGKSTLARRLARQIGFAFLDSGALYRAAAWIAWRRGLVPTDGPAIARAMAEETIRLFANPETAHVEVGGKDVSREIRTPEISELVSPVATLREVRDALIGIQRDLGARSDLVAEGRDMGTVVFPWAQLKFFLTASLGERARRRSEELAAAGYPTDLATVEEQIIRRDRIDETREVAPLKKPDDAVLVDTTGLTIDQVLDRLLADFRRSLPR